MDQQNAHIKVGDMVTVLDGTHVRKSGTIKHIHRSFLFLHSPRYTHTHIWIHYTHIVGYTYTHTHTHTWIHLDTPLRYSSENAGVFVSRARSCLVSGSHSKNQVSSGYMGKVTGVSDNIQMQKKQDRDESLLGKTVKIKKGVYKGYAGIVADATKTHCKV